MSLQTRLDALITAVGADIKTLTTAVADKLTDPTTTKGDIIVRGTSVPIRKGVGADDTVLTADTSAAATGFSYLAPDTNTYFRAAVYGGTTRTARPYAKIAKNASQSIAATTVTAVTFNITVEETDATFGAHASNKLVIPVNGLYAVFANTRWQIGAGTRMHRVLVNGAIVASSGAAGIAGQVNVLSLATHERLVAGDELTMEAWSSTAMDMVAILGGCSMSALWVAP